MKTVPSSVRFPDVEEEILTYWKTQGTFQKSLDKNRGKDPYIFYDGPPFATGMHIMGISSPLISRTPSQGILQ